MLHTHLSRKASRLALLLVVAILASVPAMVHADNGSISSLGFVSGGSDSAAWGISLDGSTVVGNSDSSIGTQAFYWTRSSSMVGLGILSGGSESIAYGSSSDGSVIVGFSESSVGDQAFRWTSATGMVGLGFLAGGSESTAFSVSADGTTVVGYSASSIGDQAFYWKQSSGMVGLGYLAGSSNSTAYGVSADGSVIVGFVGYASGKQAFRWTEKTGMTGLGYLTGGSSSWAWGISADGTTIVGKSDSTSGTQAFRWTAATGMTGLGILAGGSSSTAYAVNSNGMVVVGQSDSSSGYQAFRWTKNTGIQSLKTLLSEEGVDMTGWVLFNAQGVSGDGQYVVGMAFDPNSDMVAYLARYASGSSGAITLTQLYNSLSSFCQLGAGISSMSQIVNENVMQASQNALLNSLTLAQEPDPDATLWAMGPIVSDSPRDGPYLVPATKKPRLQLWTVGVLVMDNSLEGTDMGGEGGVGVTRFFDSGWSIGGGFFYGRRNWDSGFGGDQRVSMVGPGVFATYARPHTGLRLELAGRVQYADMQLKRGYQNGSGTAISKGHTDGWTLGFSARAGWDFEIGDRTVLQPFTQYSWQTVTISGYTESEGPFPASFNAYQNSSNILRSGLELRHALNDAWDIWTWGAWSHRFESHGSSMSGNLTTLFSFTYDDGPVDQDWMDAGVGVRWRPTTNIQTFSRLGFGIDNQHHSAPDLALSFGLAWDI